MKRLLYVILIAVIIPPGCGGSLSNEQREEMKEAQNNQAIKRVTEAELIAATLAIGREVVQKAERFSGQKSKLDSLSSMYKVRLQLITPESDSMLEVEKQIIEAYLLSAADGESPDNVQITGDDSLLYTKPVAEKMPDGSMFIRGMWSVHLSRKDVILTMPQ